MDLASENGLHSVLGLQGNGGRGLCRVETRDSVGREQDRGSHEPQDTETDTKGTWCVLGGRQFVRVIRVIAVCIA